jgi:hypothetical protein
VLFTESVVEEAALGWLQGLGYAVKNGIEIALEKLYANERHLIFRLEFEGAIS